MNNNSVENSILKNINKPSDLKNLSDAELELLCTEIRQTLVDTVA
jgi:deoxyxylulose-5-phosphate synthase